MQNLLTWIDLEMTGLNPSEHKIIEIATVVTNYSLEIIAQGPNVAIFQNEDVLGRMDQWNVCTHTNSGLLAKVRSSKMSVENAEQSTIDFLKSLSIEPKTSILCGNSISQDRRFLAAFMPKLYDFLHYRSLDVSSIKILANSWYNTEFTKKNSHTAYEDILESIAELKFYKEHIFIK